MRRTSRPSVGDVADAEHSCAELDGSVDVLVANPPYIPPDAEPVDPEVRDHDPDLALYGGGPDGLEVPRAVIARRRSAAAARRSARHGARRGPGRGGPRGGARSTGAFEQIESRDDLTGRPRMLVARRSSHPLVTDSAP